MQGKCGGNVGEMWGRKVKGEQKELEVKWIQNFKKWAKGRENV
jgi:hypothetical protein